MLNPKVLSFYQASESVAHRSLIPSARLYSNIARLWCMSSIMRRCSISKDATPLLVNQASPRSSIFLCVYVFFRDFVRGICVNRVCVSVNWSTLDSRRAQRAWNWAQTVSYLLERARLTMITSGSSSVSLPSLSLMASLKLVPPCLRLFGLMLPKFQFGAKGSGETGLVPSQSEW